MRRRGRRTEDPAFAVCADDAGDAGDACAACADDAGDAGDAGDADGDHEKRVDAHDARLKLASASGRAATAAAVAGETVVEAPAQGAQLSHVHDDADDADADGEKRVDGFRDARLKLVSASGRAATVAAVAGKTVVEAPARGAQPSPVRERRSSWRVTTSPPKACTVPVEKSGTPCPRRAADGPSITTAIGPGYILKLRMKGQPYPLRTPAQSLTSSQVKSSQGAPPWPRELASRQAPRSVGNSLSAISVYSLVPTVVWLFRSTTAHSKREAA